MDHFFKKFENKLRSEDKNGCILMVVQALSESQIDIVTLYTKVLTPCLNNISCDLEDKDLCIWREHVQTSIVRSVIENSYIYMVKEKEGSSISDKKSLVVIACPDGEYHEIGARMSADFFELNGLKTVFVGSSTPKTEFPGLIKFLDPAYLALGVTNSYNIVSAKRTIEEIKKLGISDMKIVVGGNAFLAREGMYKEIGADFYLNTYDEIELFAKEVE